MTILDHNEGVEMATARQRLLTWVMTQGLRSAAMNLRHPFASETDGNAQENISARISGWNTSKWEQDPVILRAVCRHNSRSRGISLSRNDERVAVFDATDWMKAKSELSGGSLVVKSLWCRSRKTSGSRIVIDAWSSNGAIFGVSRAARRARRAGSTGPVRRVAGPSHRDPRILFDGTVTGRISETTAVKTTAVDGQRWVDGYHKLD
ncbi:hypothetical protein B0H17DRAFT_1132636 [Mycena rosella]|uniref:Uncharacterized protein n=1 Tax=Mycena rosella TaxID=1033263 RepID=A0AAD7GG77_MYCRO|nr:hypothetical protein B0H17DRAFT_1132636 [Mycena rosella]